MSAAWWNVAFFPSRKSARSALTFSGSLIRSHSANPLLDTVSSKNSLYGPRIQSKIGALNPSFDLL